MFDEVEVAEETIDQPEAEPTVEEPTKEEIALEWLKEQGIEEFDPKKVKNLTEYEHSLNVKSSDLGRIAKELEASRETMKPKEDVPEFDAETVAELKKALKAAGLDVDSYQANIELAKRTVTEGREEAFETFVTSHDDVEPTELIKELMESGVDPDKLTPAALKRELNKAYKVITASKLDPEAIRKQAVADYLAELEKKGVKPDEITEVKKGRGSAAGAHRTIDDVLDDSSVSIFDKWKTINEQ